MAFHYLDKCWHTINWTLGNTFQWNFNRNSSVFIWENHLKYNLQKIAAILYRPQCVNLLYTNLPCHVWLYDILTIDMLLDFTNEAWPHSSRVPFVSFLWLIKTCRRAVATPAWILTMWTRTKMLGARLLGWVCALWCLLGRGECKPKYFFLWVVCKFRTKLSTAQVSVLYIFEALT